MQIHSTGFKAFLATSFLGAFNDNFFKLVLVCMAISHLPKEAQDIYVPVSGAIFILPYLLCSSYAGYISDRFSKRRVLIWSKWLEVLVMGFGLLLFIIGAPYCLLAVLFLMGAQSALYSPAKYGYLPEVLTKEELPRGNGATQMTTFLAIIAGTWLGGMISTWHGNAWWIGSLYCVIIASLGTATSYKINSTPAGNASAKFTWNPVACHWHTFKSIRDNRKLTLAIFGNSFFWYFAALFQNNLPLFVNRNMKLGDKELGYLLAAIGLGIGIGCFICGQIMGKISTGNEISTKGKQPRFGAIGTRIIFPAAFLTGIASILMSFTDGSLTLALLGSTVMGIFGGMYQLPLSTFMQSESPADKLGACLSFSSASDCVAMILAYVTQLLLTLCGIPPKGIFGFLGLIIILVFAFSKYKDAK